MAHDSGINRCVAAHCAVVQVRFHSCTFCLKDLKRMLVHGHHTN